MEGTNYSAAQPAAGRRRQKRRRALRPSDCPDYDRKADRPPFVSAFGTEGFTGSNDAERDVDIHDGPPILEDDGLRGEDFYREHIPPHY